MRLRYLGMRAKYHDTVEPVQQEAQAIWDAVPSNLTSTPLWNEERKRKV